MTDIRNERPVGAARAPPDPGPSHAGAADDEPISRTKVAIGVAVVLALAGLYWWLSETGTLSILLHEARLWREIDRLASWGPLAIIVFMTLAIVMSPIPSGPIAMVAGAAYGPVWGTAYVVVGAELGAIIAFGIARCLGYETVRRWRGMRRVLRRLEPARSQGWLMAIVFASRLVPFISFDAVSYAAGLTPLAFWRFALATLVGVTPVAFLLTYFGKAAIESERALLILLLIGGLTLIPIAARLLWLWHRKRRDDRFDGD